MFKPPQRTTRAGGLLIGLLFACNINFAMAASVLVPTDLTTLQLSLPEVSVAEPNNEQRGHEGQVLFFALAGA